MPQRNRAFAEKGADAIYRGADLGKRRLRAVRRDETATLQQLSRSDELGVDPGCGIVHIFVPPHWLLGSLSRLRNRCGGGSRQARHNFLCEQPDTLLGLLMVEKARTADENEMAEPAYLVVDVHDLLVDGVGIAGDQNAAADRLLGGDPDEAVGWAARSPGLWLRAIVLRCHLGRHAPRQEFRHLRRLFEAGVEKPQGLAAEPQTLLVGVTDIAEGGISEPVRTGDRQLNLAARLTVCVECPLAGFGTAQDEGIHHATPAELGGGLRIAGCRPHRRVRPLIDGWPDVDVTVSEMLALPAERAGMRGQGLGYQVDGFPEALDIADRVGVTRHHLAVARFDEADLEAAAGNDVRSRIFLGDPHRIGANRDQGPKAQDANLLGLPGEDAEDHRARPVKAVYSRVMLDRNDVDAELIAQQMLV